MKNKIYCRLPIFATARFSINKPDNWNEMSKAEQSEYFLASKSLAPEGTLCHQCSGPTETDYEVDLCACEDGELDTYEDEDIPWC
jgi:hypothetical protein